MSNGSSHRDMVVATFTFGFLAACAASSLYVLAIRKCFVFGSVELFQTLAIFIFLAWIGPSTRVIITLTLRALERGDQTVAVLKDFKDNALPLIMDAKTLVADLKGMNLQRVTDFVDKLSKEDAFGKLGEIIKRLESKAVDKLIDGI